MENSHIVSMPFTKCGDKNAKISFTLKSTWMKQLDGTDDDAVRVVFALGFWIAIQQLFGVCCRCLLSLICRRCKPHTTTLLSLFNLCRFAIFFIDQNHYSLLFVCFREPKHQALRQTMSPI
jgi:hypothetical protein